MTRFHKCLIAILSGMLALTVAAQPVNPDYQAGMRCYHQGDWNGAITNFTKSIAAGYDLYGSYGDRAYALAETGDTNGALADCGRLIALEPKWGSVYYWRSRVELEFTNSRDSDAASRDFEIGLKMDPASRPADLAWRLSIAWHNKGFKKYAAGKLDASILDFNEAVLIDPTNPYPYSIRGYVKVMQGQFDRAIADALIALKYAPKNPEAYEVLAWARFGRGDVAGAVEAGNQEQKIMGEFKNVNRGESRIIEGLLSFINGDFTKAADNWNASIKFTPDDVAAGYKPTPFTPFLQSWIEKAETKEHESKNNTPAATNGSPSANGR